MKDSINDISFENSKIVILSGGKGTRLSALLDDIPKPMIQINQKPLLEYLVIHSRKYGFKNILFKTGYLSEKIKSYFGKGEKYGCTIEYFDEKELLGTCGGLNFLSNEKEPIIVIYGDTLLNVNLTKLLKYHYDKKSQATLVVHQSDHPEDSDIIISDKDNNVIDLVHKPGSKMYGNISNAALYVLNPECFSHIPTNDRFDFAKDLIPDLLKRKYRVFSYYTEDYIKDIGTTKRFEEVNIDIQKGKVFSRVDAVFLDRDGIINEEIGLIKKKEDLKLISDASNSIKLFNNNNILTLVVTNQPVVAKNLCTIHELKEIHAYMRLLLSKDNAYLDGVYFCPHHPDKGFPGENIKYKYQCICRKPAIGLLEEAKKDYELELKKCFIIGDTTTDIQTGINAHCRTILVKSGYMGRDKKYLANPDYIFDSLLDAAKFIVKYNNSSFGKIISIINQKNKNDKRIIVIIGGCSKEKNDLLIKKINKSLNKEALMIDLDLWKFENENFFKENLYHDVAEKIIKIINSDKMMEKQIVFISGITSLDNPFLIRISQIKIFVDSLEKIPLDKKEEKSDYMSIEFCKSTVKNADFIY